jgi:hypothetical protein
MPDDIKVVAGVGDSTVAPPVATDDIGGRHFQRIKAGWGAEGVFQETTDTDGLRLPVGGGQIGALNETAPAFDTASSGLNGRLQRVAQRLTSIYNTVQVMLMDATFIDLTGLTDETAPASDTAAARLNGRLQRVAQNVTTLIGRFPTTLGQKTAANSLAVTLASDQSALPTSGGGVNAAASVNDMSTAGTGANGQAVAAVAGLRLLGFAAKETTGSANALIFLRWGTSTSGYPLTIVSLGPNESAREWYGPDGINATAGIYLERSSGSTQVVVYSKVVP